MVYDCRGDHRKPSSCARAGSASHSARRKRPTLLDLTPRPPSLGGKGVTRLGRVVGLAPSPTLRERGEPDFCSPFSLGGRRAGEEGGTWLLLSPPLELGIARRRREPLGADPRSGRGGGAFPLLTQEREAGGKVVLMASFLPKQALVARGADWQAVGRQAAGA